LWCSCFLRRPQRHIQQSLGLAHPCRPIPALNGFVTKDASNREGFPAYVADRLTAVKWRNWKMQLIQQDNMYDIPQKLALPRIYNLLTDLKEERDVGAW